MTYLLQPSFSGGELSPTLYSRVDIEKYQSGAKKIKNFIVEKHGGVTNRPGTYFIGEAYDSNHLSRLVPFQFSVTQAYSLEFSEYRMRVIRDGGLVVSSASSSVIVSFATPWASSELADIDFIQSADVLYVVHPDHYPRKISRTAHDVWTVEQIEFVDGPYVSNTVFDFDAQDVILTPDSHYSGSVAISSPQAIFKDSMAGQRLRLGYFNPEDIEDLQWRVGKITTVTNSASVVVDFSSYREVLGYSLNDNHRFYQGLSEWEDHSSGTSEITFAPGLLAKLTKGTQSASLRQRFDVPQNIKAKLVFKLNAKTGPVKVSVGTTDGGVELLAAQTVNDTVAHIYDVTVPEATETGSTTREIFLTCNNSSASSGNTASVEMFSLVTKQSETNQWRVPAWTDENGYPRTATFHEQRLIFGSSVEEPQTFWLSKTADFENYGFSAPIQDDDSFQITLASRQLNDVRWLASFTDLLAGTSASEWAIARGENSDAITPTSIYARAQSYLGSADLKPIIIGNSVVFVQRGGRAVHDLRYNLESDGYVTKELSIISGHFFEGKRIISWAYAGNPYSVIWCVLDDGTLLGMTYVRDQNIWAWHQHETDGQFESVCVIPKSEGDDDVYFVVKRTVGGTDYRYIEQTQPRITDADTYDFFFVDSGLSLYTSSAITTVFLPHLAGETVSVLVDGSVRAQETVGASGGVDINIGTASSGTHVVHIGLPYTSDLQSLDVELSDTLGVSQGRKKIIPRITVSLKDSRGMQIGPDEDNLDEVSFRRLSDGENPIALFTGDKTKDIPAGYESKGGIYIRNTDPIPLTILSIIPEIELSEA